MSRDDAAISIRADAPTPEAETQATNSVDGRPTRSAGGGSVPCETLGHSRGKPSAQVFVMTSTARRCETLDAGAPPAPDSGQVIRPMSNSTLRDPMPPRVVLLVVNGARKCTLPIQAIPGAGGIHNSDV